MLNDSTTMTDGFGTTPTDGILGEIHTRGHTKEMTVTNNISEFETLENILSDVIATDWQK